MKIVHARPPNFDKIAAVFPQAKGKNVVFTYGSCIYVPSGGELRAWTKAHEGVHYSRQTDDVKKIEAWWDRYLVDPEFRLAEELPAHRAEWKSIRQAVRDRNARAQMLKELAQRLASPFYGNLLTLAKARVEIAK